VIARIISMVARAGYLLLRALFPWAVVRRAGDGHRRPVRVFAGDVPAKEVLGVYALWNGGPGAIEQAAWTPDAARDLIYVSAKPGHIASGFRLAWRVRVESV